MESTNGCVNQAWYCFYRMVMMELGESLYIILICHCSNFFVLNFFLKNYSPEHSSARLERFLQLSNEPVDRELATSSSRLPNWTVINPTTPANYFHALRRQLKWPFRKPLIVIAPKTLIRLPECVSPLADMAPGTSFRPALADSTVEADKVNQILLCSGKLYYELVQGNQYCFHFNTIFLHLKNVIVIVIMFFVLW